MPIPKQNDELTRYLVRGYIKPWVDARDSGEWAEKCNEIDDRFANDYRPGGLPRSKQYLHVNLVKTQIMIAYGIVNRADRAVSADPVGDEDSSAADVFKEVASVMFKESGVYEAFDEAVLSLNKYGRGHIRVAVDGEQLNAQSFDPRSVIPDPRSRKRNHKDRRGTLLVTSMPLDEARVRWGDAVAAGDWHKSITKDQANSQSVSNDVPIVELEWWCPANGKVWFDGGTRVIDSPEEFERAVPESDRDTWSVVETDQSQGYWRLTTLAQGSGGTERWSIVEDKPTGLSRSIWVHLVKEFRPRGKEGAVGIGTDMRDLGDAASGAISIALNQGLRGSAAMTFFRDPLHKEMKDAIEAAEDAAFDNMGDDLDKAAKRIPYGDAASAVPLLQAGFDLLRLGELQGGLPDVAGGRSPVNPKSGRVIEELVSAASNNVIHLAKSIEAGADDLALLGGEMIQRLIPYGTVVTITDEQNRPRKLVIGALPPEGADLPFRMLRDRNAPLYYDVHITIDIEEAVERNKREAQAQALLDGGHIDLEAYFEMRKDAHGKKILEGLNERNTARSLAAWIQEHPDEAARIQGLMELEQQQEAMGIPLTDEAEAAEDERNQ